VRPLAISIIVVALFAGAHLLTGIGGVGYELVLLFSMSTALRAILPAGLHLGDGPFNGAVVMFWLDMIVFMSAASGLYAARRRLGSAYPLLLAVWTAAHIGLMFLGPIRVDWP